MLVDESEAENEKVYLENSKVVSRMTVLPETLSPEQSLRMQLLIISKDTLLSKSAMKWETHKTYEDVSVDSIISEASKMFVFVLGKDSEG